MEGAQNAPFEKKCLPLISSCLSIKIDQVGRILFRYHTYHTQNATYFMVAYYLCKVHNMLLVGAHCIGSILWPYKAYTSTQKVSTFKYLVGLIFFFFLGLKLSNMIYTYLPPPWHTWQIFGILYPLFPACYCHLLRTLASTYSIASWQSKHLMLVWTDE